MLKATRKCSTKLKPYVNNILVFEEKKIDSQTTLPFFADGYPGIVFNITESGLYLKAKNKRLSEFFLYGQTIEPIKITVKGAYKMIVFQLYPFATKLLLGIEPEKLNDDCYDLKELWDSVNEKPSNKIWEIDNSAKQIDEISNFLIELAEKNSSNVDKSIVLAINLILKFKGQVKIKELTSTLFVTERTFERRFKKEIGVTPKRFCKIIQFQNSLNNISTNEKSKMLDAVYENGFTDQSHFIKTFKKFTGVTPSEFEKLPVLANF